MTPVAVKSLKRFLVAIASAGTVFWAAIPSPDSTEDRQKECFRQRIARLSYTSVEPDMTTIEVRPPEWVDITFKGETARILYLNNESAHRAASVGLRMWRAGAGNGWSICSEDWIRMAITTTSSSAPAGEPVRGYQCLVSGIQTGFVAGAFRGAAPPGGTRRGHGLHDRTGASGIVARLPRSARSDTDHRLLRANCHDRTYARRSHLRGPTAQRMPSARHTGRNHRCAARPALHRPQARHVVDRPGFQPHRGAYAPPTVGGSVTIRRQDRRRAGAKKGVGHRSFTVAELFPSAIRTMNT